MTVFQCLIPSVVKYACNTSNVVFIRVTPSYNLHLPIALLKLQSAPITNTVVGSYAAQTRCTRYNII